MQRWLKWALISLAITATMVALALATLRSVEKRARETKSVRELTATVTGKGYRQYSTDNYKYIDNGRYIYQNEEGDEYQRNPPDEDWLIYYDIDYFDPRDEPTSRHLMELEKQRITSGKRRRVTIFSKQQYDQTNVGDKIHLNYQRFNDSKVMIW